MIVRSLVLTHYTVPACDGLSHARMADRAAERDRNETKKYPNRCWPSFGKNIPERIDRKFRVHIGIRDIDIGM